MGPIPAARPYHRYIGSAPPPHPPRELFKWEMGEKIVLEDGRHWGGRWETVPPIHPVCSRMISRTVTLFGLTSFCVESRTVDARTGYLIYQCTI